MPSRIGSRHLPQDPVSDIAMNLGDVVTEEISFNSADLNVAEQLRALSGSLLKAQEQERRRISRDLHDNLTQRLALLAIDLGRLAGGPPDPPDPLRQRLCGLQNEVLQITELVRHIAYNLHPVVLDDLGLAAALRSICHDFARRHGIPARCSANNLPEFMSQEAGSCLYRITQEALQNIGKHARAKRAAVKVAGRNSHVRLEIRDNGIGFDPGSLSTGVGLGILSMKERVRLVNGSFQIESKPGKGSRIIVEIPL